MSHRLEYTPPSQHGEPPKGADHAHEPGHLQSNVFTYSLEERLRGMSGVPSWVRRAKELEDAEDHFWKHAESRWLGLKQADLLPGEFARAWKAVAEGFDYAHLQDLAEHFNAYYPIEANLPTDPLTGTFMVGEHPFQTKHAPTLEHVLARFPMLD